MQRLFYIDRQKQTQAEHSARTHVHEKQLLEPLKVHYIRSLAGYDWEGGGRKKKKRGGEYRKKRRKGRRSGCGGC